MWDHYYIINVSVLEEIARIRNEYFFLSFLKIIGTRDRDQEWDWYIDLHHSWNLSLWIRALFLLLINHSLNIIHEALKTILNYNWYLLWCWYWTSIKMLFCNDSLGMIWLTVIVWKWQYDFILYQNSNRVFVDEFWCISRDIYIMRAYSRLK